jgi:hypothetical protein
MAKKKWITLPGGRIKRWKKSENESGCNWVHKTTPHWYRNYLNRRERGKSRQAIFKGKAHSSFPYIHPGSASWYW